MSKIKPKASVLLIEDDQLLLKAMKSQFQTSDFTVKTAENGEMGLKILKRWIPSAIILDILMPGIDGYQVLKQIKSSEKTKSIPVIIASNLNQEKDKDTGIDLSAADFLVKSDMSISNLVKKTAYYISMSKHGKESIKQ